MLINRPNDNAVVLVKLVNGDTIVAQRTAFKDTYRFPYMVDGNTIKPYLHDILQKQYHITIDSSKVLFTIDLSPEEPIYVEYMDLMSKIECS